MSRIQLFAYEIATGDTAKINSILTDKGLAPAKMSELDHFKAQAQLQADLIKAEVAPNSDPKALPIFMAPEFFFKAYDGLPYGMEAFYEGCEELKRLSAGFPEVLWVIGTVWWKQDQDDLHALVHNSALVLKNGRIAHSWQKEHLSNIDGLKKGSQIWDRDVHEMRQALENTQNPFFPAPPLPPGVSIPMATESIGIEVCLDHKMPPDGSLRTAYINGNDAAAGGVDVHLLIAAGMDMKPANIVAKDGGYFLRVDGLRFPRSQCLRVDRVGKDPGAALRQWNPKLTDIPAQHVGKDPDNRLALYPAVDIP